MTNKQIIESIKIGETAAIEELAAKYGITIEQAERIAESIIKHNARSIRKMQDKRWTHGFKILVGWRGYGFLGSFDTNTEFCFTQSGDMYGIYGD